MFGIAPLLILASLATAGDAPRLAYAQSGLSAADESVDAGTAPRLDYGFGTGSVGPIRSTPARLVESSAGADAAPPPLAALSGARAEQRWAGFIRAAPPAPPPLRRPNYRAAPPAPAIPARF